MHPTQEFHNIAPILGGCFGIFLMLAISIFVAFVYCKIFAKAGFHWALGLLMFVPIVNLIAILVLAFSEWPIERKLRDYRQAAENQSPKVF